MMIKRENFHILPSCLNQQMTSEIISLSKNARPVTNGLLILFQRSQVKYFVAVIKEHLSPKVLCGHAEISSIGLKSFKSLKSWV